MEDYQLGVQGHMQALTELRQYVRAEQNRPVLGATSEQGPQGGGPGMGGLGALLSSLVSGHGGGGVGRDMMIQEMMAQGGGGGALPSASPAVQEQEQNIPGSKRRKKRRKGGLVEMPGMGNYPALMGGAGY